MSRNHPNIGGNMKMRKRREGIATMEDVTKVIGKSRERTRSEVPEYLK